MPTRERRLILFDIDGTLLASAGAGSSAMRAAFAALWRDHAAFEGISFAGRTDYAILKQALTTAGLYGEMFADDLRRFKRAYFRRLRRTLAATPGRVLPGAVELLRELSTDQNTTLALGTGNFRTGAMLKLRHYGLDGFFRCGGFGDHTDERSLLIAQGIRSANRAAGRHSSVFVIGDTVHDIAAAKANGAIGIGVLTGGTSEWELSAAGAEAVLPTLESALDLFSPARVTSA